MTRCYLSKKIMELKQLFVCCHQTIPVHTAEVLRQVANSNVRADGGWVGGDAWFGSVASCVAVWKELSVDSTFVVKQNDGLFPKRPLMAVMKARHGSRPAGHWVVMTSEISGVKLLAIAFAWSQKSTAFFISTVGTTAPALQSYASNFEDEYGNTCTKFIRRPEIVDFIYRFLPVIDNHNKSRQHLLKLEKKWPTRDCWFCLFTTLVGFSVVDLYRLYRCHNEKQWDKYTVLQFSDMICNGLLPRNRIRLPAAVMNAAEGSSNLRRIRDPKTGDITKQLTNKQKLEGKSYRAGVGTAVQHTCWVCRLYRGPTEKLKYTSKECVFCSTPLCSPSVVYEDRESCFATCYQEHHNSLDPRVKCNKMPKGKVTKDLMKQ